jgi:hypothetical protein
MERTGSRERLDLTLKVNGLERRVSLDARVTLRDALREYLPIRELPVRLESLLGEA